MSDPKCLEETILLRFVRRQLPEVQTHAVEEHLRHCSRCVARVDVELATLNSMIRLVGQEIQNAEQEQIERLILQLEGLVISHSTDTDLTRDPTGNEEFAAESANSFDPTHFLGAPVESGELGRLGSYRVLELIGMGGIGAVFRAEDPLLRREVAIKVIRRKERSERIHRYLLREAQALASLDDEHIVPIWQVGEYEGQYFFVMPLLRGESLGTFLGHQDRVPLSLVLSIARQTAEGLSAAHAAGLIHRDLKPDNLWLETRAKQIRVRILDFGLVVDWAAVSEVCSTQIVAGTLPYAAPEQLWGGPMDYRADLFSLGCILYRCLSGQHAVSGRTRLDVLAALANQEIKPLQEVAPEVPQPVAELVMRLLARHPQARPDSARDVAQMVERLEAIYSPGTAD